MSPRSTQRLHQPGNGQHLVAIIAVRLEPRDFSGELRSKTKPACSVDQRRPDRLGPGHTGRLQGAQGTRCFIIEPDRDRLSHSSRCITTCRTRAAQRGAGATVSRSLHGGGGDETGRVATAAAISLPSTQHRVGPADAGAFPGPPLPGARDVPIPGAGELRLCASTAELVQPRGDVRHHEERGCRFMARRSPAIATLAAGQHLPRAQAPLLRRKPSCRRKRADGRVARAPVSTGT